MEEEEEGSNSFSLEKGKGSLEKREKQLARCFHPRL
jgi:hypothetical protein